MKRLYSLLKKWVQHFFGKEIGKKDITTPFGEQFLDNEKKSGDGSLFF